MTRTRDNGSGAKRRDSFAGSIRRTAEWLRSSIARIFRGKPVEDFSDEMGDLAEMPSPVLGASAVADRALVFDGAASHLHPSGFDPIAREGA